MPYCIECGQELDAVAHFCYKCGTPTMQTAAPNNEERTTVFEGEIHKCSNCGEVLKAFETVCPACKFESRGVKSSSTVKDLAEKLEQATSEKQRIIIVKNFPVPNTKEDIFEFMLLAYSNFDEDYYVSHLNVEDMSDAWLAKIKQCYRKAELTFDNAEDLIKIKELHEKINLKIHKKIKIAEKEKKKKAWKKIFPVVEIVLGLLLIITEILLLATIGLILFIVGICSAVITNKKPTEKMKTTVRWL